MSKPSYESMREVYVKKWNSIKLTGAATTKKSVDSLMKGKEQYERVAASIGCDWWIIGLIHMRESSYNMKTHLHNGDPLTARTVHVPAGRPATGNPPFDWFESAIDALASRKNMLKEIAGLKGLDKIAKLCYFLEDYNGWGYQTGSGQNTVPAKTSPYLWSKTNAYSSGKYVADGKFNSMAKDAQQGCIALVKCMVDENIISIDTEEIVSGISIRPNGIVIDGNKYVIEDMTVGKLASALVPFDNNLSISISESKIDSGEAVLVPELERTLQRGSTGEQVRMVQERLCYHGFVVDVDGDFGPQTLGAVKVFQSNRGLEVDGVVGPNTWAKLWEGGVPSGKVFSRLTLAQVAEAEAIQNISWRGNGIAKKYTSRFVPFFGSARFSWCAAFVTWCVEQCGVKVVPQPSGQPYTFALCEQWQMWAKAKGYWVDGVEGISTGDIVLFDWDGATYPDTDFEDHIGVFLRKEGSYYICAEGNVNDETAIKSRNKANIQGYVRLPDRLSLLA